MDTESRIFYVYQLIRPWNGVPCYIGKGKGRRMLIHAWLADRHPNIYLARVFRKAARLGVSIIAEKIKENLTEAEAYALEIVTIKKIGRRAHGGPLVNGTDGGDSNPSHLGKKFTAEHRAKISAALKGHAVSEKSRQAASLTHRGKTLTQEHRAAISAAQKGHKRSVGKKHSAEARAKMSASRKGKQKSPEHRAKIGEAHKGRKLSKEHVEKMILARRGKPLSDEWKAKLSAATKWRPLSQEHREKVAAANRARAAILFQNKAPMLRGPHIQTPRNSA